MEMEARKKEFGEILKAERARRRLSLDEIQAATKIRKKFLKAIEDGNFDLMPTKVAGRGFLRIYAGFLGMDPDGMVAEYNRKTEPERIPVQDEPRLIAAKNPIYRFEPYGKYALLALVALVVTAGIYFVLSTP